MIKLMLMLAVAGILMAEGLMAGEIYRWTDKNGNIVFSDSPPASGSFKKQNIKDEVDKVIDQIKDVEKRTDIDASDKLDQKIKLEIDYQKKAKSIRDYDAMREELAALHDRYQKKFEELKRQWNRNFPNSLARHDILEEAEKLKREYEKEVTEIKKLYGYY